MRNYTSNGIQELKQYLNIKKTMQRIMDDLEMMNPEDLLPEDQYLLGVDPEDLATASKDRQKVWQAELKTAVAAAKHVTTQLNYLPNASMKTYRQHTSNHTRLRNVYMRLDVIGTKPNRQNRS